jgi:hypothetical protein
MSTLLNILPGFQTCPPGAERKILRNIPLLLGLGSLLIFIPSFIGRMFAQNTYLHISAASVKMYDILGIGTLIVYWLAIFTITIGAILVSLMKGPAYVADAYPMEDLD